MSTEKNTMVLPVENMDSEHCALIVDKALGTVPSVSAHHVELNNRSAVIESSTPVEAVRDVVKAIRENGYDVPTLRRTFPVTGMTCASCVSSVESMLLAQPGVLNAAVNLATNTVQVEYVPGVIEENGMREVVQSIGYDLLIGNNNKKRINRKKHTKPN
jgi:Cu2+-exporting ATPase